jgi:SAGA-associated factor 29
MDFKFPVCGLVFVPVCSIWLTDDRIVYEVVNIDPDGQSPTRIFRAWAVDLIPIPKTGSGLATHGVGTRVLAKYPQTTFFYPANVRSCQGNVYFLEFKGGKSGTETVEVEKRFVLDDIRVHTWAPPVPPEVRVSLL